MRGKRNKKIYFSLFLMKFIEKKNTNIFLKNIILFKKIYFVKKYSIFKKKLFPIEKKA